MDINTIIESSFNNNTSKVQETLPKSSLNVKTTSENVFAKKMSDWQEGKDVPRDLAFRYDAVLITIVTRSIRTYQMFKQAAEALLSLKKDPAVLEAKVSIKDEDVSYPQNAVQPPRKSTEFQPRSTPEARLNRLDFESKMCMERAALLSLPSDQFSLILKYVQILRQQRMTVQRQNECGFCKNNKQPEVWYNTHVLKDAKGRVRCPVLRSYVCPLCGATGNHAHTITHCPKTWRR